MANKQQSKVRFVRCPKCTKILPEPEHVPLYACGSCGAILQAKNYRGPQENTALSSQDVLKRNGTEHACYIGESSNSSRRSSSDHSPVQEEGRSSNGVENPRVSEQNGVLSSFDNSSLSNDPSFFNKKENGEIVDGKFEESCRESDRNGSASYMALSKEVGGKENGDRERKSDQSDSKDRGAIDHPSFLENEPKELTGVNSVIEDNIGEDKKCNGIDNEKLHRKHMGVMNSDRGILTQDDDDDDDDDEPLIRPVKSVKDASLTEKSTQLSSENPAKNDASEYQQSKELTELHLVEKRSNQDVLRNEINLHKLDEQKLAKPGKNASSLIESSELTQSVSEIPGKHFAFDHEVSKQGSKMHFVEVEVQQDTSGNDINNLDVNAAEVEKSTNKNDVSERLQSVRVSTPSSVVDLKTSYETGPTKFSQDLLQKNLFDKVNGTSNQNIDRKARTFLNEIPESSSKKSPAYEGSVSSFDGNDDKVEEQPSRRARNSSSMVLDEKFKRRMMEEGGLLDRNEIHPRFRSNKETFMPQIPNPRSSELIYETGSTSSYALYDEPLRHQMPFRHPYVRRSPESSLWREKEFLPMYYNSESSGELYDGSRHRPYIDRRRRTESWSQNGTHHRYPYSGEIFSGRYPFMNHYPKDRRWSTQLPPPDVYFQGGYVNPSWESRWDPYESDPSCFWAHDTMSIYDDPRHKDEIMREMFLREKRQAMKTPFYPIAGGTPFITCYFCFHILQLPRDFLRSRRKRRERKSHKLKCGACSRVLEFFLENEGGLTPCETNLDKNVNLGMSSNYQANHSRQSSVTSIDSRILLSRDSFGASNREKRKSGSRSSSKGEKADGLHDHDDHDDDDDAHPVRGRPSKVTWQLPSRSKSPLHKLMGYSSPNEMLAFHESDDKE